MPKTTTAEEPGEREQAEGAVAEGGSVFAAREASAALGSSRRRRARTGSVTPIPASGDDPEDLEDVAPLDRDGEHQTSAVRVRPAAARRPNDRRPSATTSAIETITGPAAPSPKIRVTP